jgi:hypothetical protein
MLIHTRPRHAGGSRVDPSNWTVRVAGADVVLVAAGAKAAGATVHVTRRGVYWFATTADRLPAVRAETELVATNWAGWLLWARAGRRGAEGGGGADPVDDAAGV